MPANIKDAVLNLMEESGALPVNDKQYNVLRIEADLPRAGYELTGEYTPLEVGLKNMVSETKGCYTGQEVIARQINYDKVTQSLTGLNLQESIQIDERIWFDNKSVGGNYIRGIFRPAWRYCPCHPKTSSQPTRQRTICWAKQSKCR